MALLTECKPSNSSAGYKHFTPSGVRSIGEFVLDRSKDGQKNKILETCYSEKGIRVLFDI